MARKPLPAAAAASSSSSSDSSDPNSNSNSTSQEEEPEQLTQNPNPDSDSDSDSDSPPLKIKPLSSSPSPKTMQKQQTSKRPARDNGNDQAKKAKTDEGGSGGGSSKKVLFQRLWSEEDELVILKGMIDYKAKKSRDPMAFPDDFLDFIKKSLHFVAANKSQIVNKVQRLKKKFENANAKTKKRKISNPIELKAFELSKQIWGGGSGGGAVRVHDNGVSNSKGDVVKKVESGRKKGKVGNWVVSRCDTEMLTTVVGGGSGSGSSGLGFGFLNEGVLKQGVKLLGEKERVEMADKFRKHNVAETEVYLKRLDLVREVTQKALNAIKSAQN